jgi:PAS domain S-box-containing protein
MREKEFRMIFEGASDAIFWADAATGILVNCNKAAEEMLEVPRDEIIGKHQTHLHPPEMADHYSEQFKGSIALIENSDNSEAIVFSKSGRRIPVEIKHSVTNVGGREIMQGLFRDITERKNAEEALRESEERFRNLLQEVPSIAVQGYGPDGTAQFWNLASEKLYGYSAQEAIGRNLLDLIIPPEMRGDVEQAIRYMAETGQSIPASELSLMRKDGSQVPVFSSHTIVKVSGRVQELFCLDIDMSELKQAEQEKQALEQQLQHAQKLESLGVLAGGIAHDFNNILAIIVGHCSLAMVDPDRAGTSIPIIEKAAQRAAELCRQMLAYAGKAHFVQTMFDLGELVDEMVHMLKSSLPQNVVIKLDSPCDMPLISGDASQIRQVVMNLIINASEAIGESHGEIRVSLTTTEIRSGQQVRDHLGKALIPGWYAILDVSDNGCGMDNETRQRLFEPFYTTKFTGRGLGMSAVLGIITSHGGALQLVSQSGQGTTFKVYLPVQISCEPDGDGSLNQLSAEPWQGSGTVLLVEDEEMVMPVAQSMLEMLGFRVVGACNGKEALAVYQKNAVDISLVVTDIGMPVMDGYELFRELKSRKPELPIIISSGFGDSVVTSNLPGETIAGLISKPYNFNQLRELLKRVVEEM